MAVALGVGFAAATTFGAGISLADESENTESAAPGTSQRTDRPAENTAPPAGEVNGGESIGGGDDESDEATSETDDYFGGVAAETHTEESDETINEPDGASPETDPAFDITNDEAANDAELPRKHRHRLDDTSLIAVHSRISTSRDFKDAVATEEPMVVASELSPTPTLQEPSNTSASIPSEVGARDFTWEPPLKAPSSVVGLSSRLMAVLKASSSALSGSGLPPESPFLLAMLAWGRRESQRSLVGGIEPSAQMAAMSLATVNSAPTAVNDGPFTVTKNGSITLTWAQLLGNDIDPDKANGDVLAVNSVSSSKGTVVNNVAAKTVTFTPIADYVGSASFVYRVKDSSGATSGNLATVAVQVTSPNTAPTAVNDGPFTVTKNGSITLTWAQLLGNDIDPDKANGDVLAVNSVSSSKGTVVNNVAAKTVTFTPIADYVGSASFVYRVKDSSGTTSANLSTVSVTVLENAGSGSHSIDLGGTTTAVTRVSPDGTRIYAGSGLLDSPSVVVIDAATSAVISRINLGPEAAYNGFVGVAVSPDGQYVYATSQYDGVQTRPTVHVISTATNSVIRTIPIGAAYQPATGMGSTPLGLSSLVVSPDGERLYVSTTVDTPDTTSAAGYRTETAIHVIDTTAGTVVSTIPVGNSDQEVITALTINAAGDRVYAATYEATYDSAGKTAVRGLIYAVDTATNTVAAAISVDMPATQEVITAIALTPNGNKLYATGYLLADTATAGAQIQGVVYVVNTATSTVTATVLLPELPTGVTVSRDGARAYTAAINLPGDEAFHLIDAIENSDAPLGAVHMIDTATDTVSATIRFDALVAPGPVSNIDVSRDGTRLYVSGIAYADGSARGVVTAIDTSSATVLPLDAASSADSLGTRIDDFDGIGSATGHTGLLIANGTAAHASAGLLFGNGFSYDATTCITSTGCAGGDAALIGHGGKGFRGGRGGDAALVGLYLIHI